MDNGSVSASELATLSLVGGANGRLGGIGVGGYGYGGDMLSAGNSVLSADAHANGTATKEAIDCHSTRFSDGLNTLSSQFDNQTRSGQFAVVNKNISDAEQRLSDLSVASEFRSLDRQRDIERTIADNAKESAKCCCETQKLIVAEGNETRALILAVEGRANVAQLASAQAKITQLETINALNAGGHGKP